MAQELEHARAIVKQRLVSVDDLLCRVDYNHLGEDFFGLARTLSKLAVVHNQQVLA